MTSAKVRSAGNESAPHPYCSKFSAAAPSGGGCIVFEPDHLVRLRTLRSLDDVEFDLIAFFQAFVAVILYGAVVDEDVRSAVAS